MANFSKEEIERQWAAASTEGSPDPVNLRKDHAGAWMKKSEYGNRDSPWGWDIDHAYPESKGGGNDPINLRAMQWENNLSKSDSYPKFTSVVSSDGTKKISKETTWEFTPEFQAKIKELYKKR